MSKALKIPSKLSTDLAYLCGVFAGDGSINYRNTKKEYSLKCVGNPKDEINFYKEIICPKFEKVFGVYPILKKRDSGKTFGFVIFSKDLVNFLTQKIGLPLGKKYNFLKVPNLFVDNKPLIINFIQGLFDTDGCICFKRKYKNYPYYPVISFSSKSKTFTQEVASFLKSEGFQLVESYDYKTRDQRTKKGFTVKSILELNGENNLNLWNKKIGFRSPKHLKKIKENWKE